MLVVGIVLVHNEDLFVEQSIRNIAGFCDRIHAVDHLSTDRTWEILQSLAREYDHLDVRRARHARVSHEVLAPYVGSDVWVLQADGDELYDPVGLERTHEMLAAGELDGAFRVQANVLHCVSLDRERGRASGYLSPPSRPLARLFNLAVANSWTDCGQRLVGGRVDFRPGFGWDSVIPLQDRFSWDESPFRFLHTCFLRRSSLDPVDSTEPRRSLSESGYFRRGWMGAVARAVRPPKLDPLVEEITGRGSTWKLEKYRRGPLVEKDVSVFLGTDGRDAAQVSAKRVAASSSSRDPVKR
jgi:glycosyltransferase involved in cell wall biosynthesis